MIFAIARTAGSTLRRLPAPDP